MQINTGNGKSIGESLHAFHQLFFHCRCTCVQLKELIGNDADLSSRISPSFSVRIARVSNGTLFLESQISNGYSDRILNFLNHQTSDIVAVDHRSPETLYPQPRMSPKIPVTYQHVYRLFHIPASILGLKKKPEQHLMQMMKLSGIDERYGLEEHPGVSLKFRRTAKGWEIQWFISTAILPWEGVFAFHKLD